MDTGGLAVGFGAELGEPLIVASHKASSTQFDAFLSDIREKTRHDIQQAKRELLDGMHDFSALAITAHCDSMLAMAKAVEHSADAAAAAFERSFNEYRQELAKRDKDIASLTDELIMLRHEMESADAQALFEARESVWGRMWSEIWNWLKGDRK